jgi:2-alkyl-3-oxoalkanoate reductase
MKRRVGLVGAGYISEYHITALRRLPDVELVGLTDIDTARASKTAEKFGVRAFSSLKALKDAGVNAVHVLTPPHTHTAVTLEALDLGCDVLVEKPLSEEAADGAKIQARADEYGLKVCVNHSLLFDPQIKNALKLVRSGKIGKIVSMDILRGSVYPPFEGGPLPPQYRKAGYPFRDLGVHALYLFQAFLGPIEAVDADWKKMGGDPNLAYDEWRARVRCKGGMGQFQLSWNVKPLQHQIILQGTRGVLRVDLFLMFHSLRGLAPLPGPALRIVNAVTDSIMPMIEVPQSVFKFVTKKIRQYHGLGDLIEAFYASLDGGTPVPVTVADAAPIVEWTEKVARAADADWEATKARITLSPEIPVLVTGASGSLGGAVVDRLRAEGKRVRVMVRTLPDRVPEGVEIALGDLGDPAAVDRAVKGAKMVIHVGAAMKGGLIEHKAATVIGTRNVLEACTKHGVEKLVHVSSMSVVDWAGGPDGSTVNEHTAFEPRAEDRGAYTQCKLEAEKLVTEWVRDKGLHAVILRPGQIFGSRIPLLTGAIARRIAGRWLVLGDGKIPLPLVYIDDVVDAILLAAKGPLHKGEIIQIIGGEELTQDEVLEIAGGGKPVLHFPRPLLFAIGKSSEIALGLVKRKSPLSEYRLKSALAKRRFESLTAEPLLGWKARVGVAEGIRRVLSEEPRLEGAK